MLTFPNVTPEVFALVLDQLRAEGSKVVDSGADTYEVTGHHWMLGTIKSIVTYKLDTAYVSVVQPTGWEDKIGSKIRDAIALAQQAVAKAQLGGPDRAA